MMQNENQPTPAAEPADRQEDVLLNLTISGAREQILCLLKQMDAVPGFSVVKGSFIVLPSGQT